MTKPVTPKTHGIIDYVFTGVQAAAPRLLKLNKNAVSAYTALSVGFGVVNAVTDTPAAVKRVVPFKTHQKLDARFLAGLALLTLAPMIRKNKKTLTFHLAFLATAVAHYVLTDYNAEP